jgi:hypothetical protein
MWIVGCVWVICVDLTPTMQLPSYLTRNPEVRSKNTACNSRDNSVPSATGYMETWQQWTMTWVLSSRKEEIYNLRFMLLVFKWSARASGRTPSIRYVMTIQIFFSISLPVACPFTKWLTLNLIMQTEAEAYGNNTSKQIRNAWCLNVISVVRRWQTLINNYRPYQTFPGRGRGRAYKAFAYEPMCKPFETVITSRPRVFRMED